MVAASRGTIYLIAAQALFVLLGFALNAFLARSLGPGEFGVLGVAITFALALTTLISAGFTGATAKFASEFPAKAGFIDRYVSKVLLVFSAIVVVLTFAFADFIAAFLGSASLAWPLRFASLLIPTQVIYSERLSLLNAFKNFDKIAIGIAALAASKLAIAFGLVWSGFGVVGALFGHVLSPLVGFLLAGKKVVETKEVFSVDKIKQYALPYSISAGLLVIVQNLDIFAVQAIVRDGVTTGLYVASTTLSRAMVVLLGAVAVGMFPTVSQLTSQKSRNIAPYIRTALLYVFTLIIPISFFLASSSYNVLALFFSEQYIAGSSFLQVLSLSAALTTVMFVCFGILNAGGETKKALFITIVFLVVESGFIWFAGNVSGAVGIAYATLFSTLLLLASTLFIISNLYGKILAITPLVKLILSGVIASVLVYLLQQLVTSKWMLVPAIAIGLPVYFALVALLRAYSLDEVKLANGFVPKVFQPWLIKVETLLGYKL